MIVPKYEYIQNKNSTLASRELAKLKVNYLGGPFGFYLEGFAEAEMNQNSEISAEFQIVLTFKKVIWRPNTRISMCEPEFRPSVGAKCGDAVVGCVETVEGGIVYFLIPWRSSHSPCGSVGLVCGRGILSMFFWSMILGEIYIRRHCPKLRWL